jgi:hypothetical protein
MNWRTAKIVGWVVGAFALGWVAAQFLPNPSSGQRPKEVYVPQAWGVYRGGPASSLVFEDSGGTIRAFDGVNGRLEVVVKRN